MYTGLLISKHTSGEKANIDRLLIEDSLIKKYGNKAKNPHFITFEDGGIRGTYLMMDATFNSLENAAPGQKPSTKAFGEPKGFEAYVGKKPPARAD
jgi:hypothetical protein